MVVVVVCCSGYNLGNCRNIMQTLLLVSWGLWRLRKIKNKDIRHSLVNEVLKGDIRAVFIKILPDSFSLRLPVLCINLCHFESQEIYQT